MLMLIWAYPTVILSAIPIALVIKLIYVLVYRLYLHPLAKARVPGPKLAAATSLVDFYHNRIKDGTFYRKLEEWHEIYGPVVRITPDEVHICDPNAYEMIYHVGTKYTKDPNFYDRLMGDSGPIVVTSDNEEHHLKRARLNHLYSKQVVQSLGFIIRSHVQKLCDVLTSRKEMRSTEPLDISRYLRSISLDVITEYAFGKPMGLLDSPDVGEHFHSEIAAVTRNFAVNRMLPTSVVSTLTHLPSNVVKHISEGGAMLAQLTEDCRRQVVNLIEERKQNKDLKAPGSRRTLFHEFLDPTDDIPKAGNSAPLTVEYMTWEAASQVGAAHETTGAAMEMTLLGVLADNTVHEKLKEELQSKFADTDQMTLEGLETLCPYLVACVKEGLRLSYGVPGRLPRVVQEKNVQFHGYKLPIGTVVSCCNYFIHRDPAIFPRPLEFLPERWLDPKAKNLNKYLLSFSKGSRQCIGMNLAYGELYMTVALVIGGFNIRIADSSVFKKVDDIEYADHFSSYPRVKGHRIPSSGLEIVVEN